MPSVSNRIQVTTELPLNCPSHHLEGKWFLGCTHGVGHQGPCEARGVQWVMSQEERLKANQMVQDLADEWDAR